MTARWLASARALLFCSLPLILAGCPPLNEPTDHFDPARARSSLARETNPAVTPTDRVVLEDGETAFSLDLYRSLSAEPSRARQNLFFSPYSLYNTLAMAYAGARGDTEHAMSQVLHASALTQASFHAAFNQLDLALSSRGQNQSGTGGNPFRLRATSDVWGQQNLDFKASFLDILGVNYGTGVALQEFTATPENARANINRWVNQQTESRVSELLPPGAVSSRTKLVLTGAVYFDAAWASPFPAAATTSQSFHSLDGSTRPVPTMKQQDLGGWFAQGDGWTYLSVPYAGGEVAFDLVLPDAGRFAEIEGKIDLTQLDLMRAALQPDTGTLSLPRFSVAGQTFSVKRALTDLGMGVAFSDSADFSGITSGADLMLDDMLHQALVKVDEQGTEAAAASAAIVVDESFNPGSFQVTVDRPFVFFIRDVQTSTLLFAGRVVTLG